MAFFLLTGQRRQEAFLFRRKPVRPRLQAAHTRYNELKKGQDSDLGRTFTGLPPRLFHPLPAWSCRHPQLYPTSSPLKLLHQSLTPHQIPLGSPPHALPIMQHLRFQLSPHV